MLSSRRAVLAGLSAMALAPALAACGDSGAESVPTRDAAGDGSEAAASFPVTLSHKFGETTIERAPARVVCVGLTEQDALLAVGVVPVAVTEWFGEAPGFIFPWATAALEAAGGDLPAVLSATDGVDVEKVASLTPHLIIGQYAGLTEKEYDLLSKIAPTVAQPGNHADYGAPWDEMALTIGKAVGKDAEMRSIVDDVKQQIEEAAAANPAFAGKTAMVVTPLRGALRLRPPRPSIAHADRPGVRLPGRGLRRDGGRVRDVDLG